MSKDARDVCFGVHKVTYHETPSNKCNMKNRVEYPDSAGNMIVSKESNRVLGKP